MSTFETMTYPQSRCNYDHSHFLHFHLAQDNCMLEIWMDRDNDTRVRIVANKSNQHLVTYHFLLRSSGHLYFLLFHLRQGPRMLEIWMDDDNDAKVRIVVADKSYQHLKQWLTIYFNTTLVAHTFYCSTISPKISACWRFEWIVIIRQTLEYNKYVKSTIWNNDLPRVPLQLWLLTLPTFPSWHPRQLHAGDLNGSW